MASSVGKKRKSSASPSIKDLVRGARTSALDAFALLAIGLGAGLVFGLSPDAREWAVRTLGYGWAPVILWLAVVLVAFRYNHRAVIAHWRRWTAAAVGVIIALGILSTVHPAYSTFEDSGLAGDWGAVIGGSPAALTALKLLAIAALTALVLRPKLVGSHYLRVLRHGFAYLQLGLVYFYMACYKTAHFLDRRVRMARYALYRRQPMAKLKKLFSRGQKAAPVRIPAYQEHDAPVDLEPLGLPLEMDEDAAISDQDGGDSSLIPTWQSTGPPVRHPVAAGGGTVKKVKPGWHLPSIDLLSPPDTHHAPEAALQKMARLVETTLGDHGVRVEVTDIKAGPRIVRFGLVPGWVPKRGDSSKANDADSLERSRVKVQSILIREKDMALALKTPYLRIEAPVPGEALVGLEVPTPSPSKVHLREIIETPGFGRLATKGGLPIALGQDTGGSSVALDLAALPHILIAGATGSGKSVCINSIVASFLLTKPPDQLRMLMVDPKRVELTPFNGIPHLIQPVIVDTEEVNPALRGLIREMLRRYKLMEEIGARNIDGYNRRSPDKMPFLVLIVDELADLMMTGGYEVEQNLVRLAQLGRATGIHLVLATQRPSVNVVTGLLKANIPARAAFAVASQVDSRVILDGVGAEKLLGKGDMLLLHKESPKARRVQGTLVYDQEIDHLVEFWLSQEGPQLPTIDLSEPDEAVESFDGLDPHMMEEARELAARNPNLSASFLERRLKIGGRRAAEVLEVLEEEGFIDG